MPNGDPRDRFFYPTLTLMMEYYILAWPNNTFFCRSKSMILITSMRSSLIKSRKVHPILNIKNWATTCVRCSTMWYCMFDQQRLRPACIYASLIRAFASRSNILWLKPLSEYHLEFISLKGGCTCSSESTLVKIPHCWKSHFKAVMLPVRDAIESRAWPTAVQLNIKNSYKPWMGSKQDWKRMLWNFVKQIARNGKNLFWSIKHSGENLNKLNSGFPASSMSTYDFSTLYNTCLAS